MPARNDFLQTIESAQHGAVHDIGGSRIQSQEWDYIKEHFVKAFRNGRRPVLPEESLYDNNGLCLWSKIIYQHPYYQAADEIALFHEHGEEYADLIGNVGSIIDLGAGDTRKVAHFLWILDDRGSKATYYALDISAEFLSSNIDRLVSQQDPAYQNVRCLGLWGSFSDLDRELRGGDFRRPRLFLSLGSVLFNDDKERAIEILRMLARHMRREDSLLAGMDGHTLPDDRVKVLDSYDGERAPWYQFFHMGFKRLNEVIGEECFKMVDWNIHRDIEADPVKHQFTFEAKRDVKMATLGITFRKGDKFDWFDAHKYGPEDVKEMCQAAGLEVVKVYGIEGSRFYQYLIKKA